MANQNKKLSVPKTQQTSKITQKLIGHYDDLIDFQLFYDSKKKFEKTN